MPTTPPSATTCCARRLRWASSRCAWLPASTPLAVPSAQPFTTNTSPWMNCTQLLPWYAYSLSKWAMEQQADAVARRYPDMTLASLRFHALPLEDPPLQDVDDELNAPVTRTLWGFTNAYAAARAVALALKASYVGHKVFFIVAPRMHYRRSSRALAAKYHPQVSIRSELPSNSGFYDCSKAERLLGWRHDE